MQKQEKYSSNNDIMTSIYDVFLKHVKLFIFKSKEFGVEILDFYQKQAFNNFLPLTENDFMTSGSVVLFHVQKYSSGDVAIIVNINREQSRTYHVFPKKFKLQYQHQMFKEFVDLGHPNNL